MKIAGIDKQTKRKQSFPRHGERGTATIIALLVMGLLTIFVALALSRTTAESLIMGNDAAEARSFYAAQASIETMSRNFNKIYDVRLSPTAGDINNVQTTIPQGFTGYTFNQTLTRTGSDEVVTLAGGPYEGLTALRDPWNLDTTATGPSGVQVDLRRTFYSNRIPIFQFGVFYDDDMELSPGAAFAFGGRVHTNGNFYIRGGGTVQFNSRVSAAGEIVVDVARNGRANIANPSASEASAGFGQNIYIKDSQGVFQQLKMGEASVLGGPDVTSASADVPDGSYNPLWSCKSLVPKRYACRPTDDIFDGNLIANVTKLTLPLKLGSTADNIELIKRGTAADSQILAISRYYNKPGIRVSLADSQSRLPGGAGGIRLDANYNLLGQLNGASAKLGYKSKPMIGTGLTYKTTRLNAYRFYRGASYTTGGMPATRETWIKVEIVNVDAATLAVTTTDITEDFLSLGFTEHAPNVTNGAGTTVFKLKDWSLLNLSGYDNDPNTGTDSRAILKMQRWAIPGPPVKRSAYADQNNITQLKTNGYPDVPGTIVANGGKPVFDYAGAAPNGFSCLTKNSYYVDANEDGINKMDATIDGDNGEKAVPFPIEMFDTREGIAQETTVQWADLSAMDDISPNGVMSLVDIDVANLRKFLRGDYDGQFPNGLRSTDIPRDRGWMMYVSDRRGDKDNDGEYDMEDVYGPNDNIFQLPEDVNDNQALDVDYTWEGSTYATTTKSDMAAFFDHKTFRRGVRLINGSQLPGDMNNGFTLASENGVYISGNYNATGVATYGTPTPASDYRPVAVAAAGAPYIVDNTQVPSSVVADAVTILSNPWNGTAGWSDGASFGAPFYTGTAAANPPNLLVDYPGRPARETTIRTAILQGNTISSILDIPNQGGLFSERLNGSINNFKRFLENWRATAVPNVNYSGSLINLFHSRNNNGTFKYGSGRVYNAPNRNWVFDDSFLDATRLPPATPFFQYLQVTGFQRINN